MKIFTLVAVLCSTLLTFAALAQDGNWPKTATTAEGTVIKVYEWQPESFADNNLQAHAAISVLESGKSEPVFGVAWLKATTATTGQQMQVRSIHITDIKLPGENSDDKLESLASAMEAQTPTWNILFSQSELTVALDLNKQQNSLAGQINNAPPKIIYSNAPSILVTIDGAPKLQRNSDWGVDAVVNTPFVLVKDNDRFYLYGGKHWYSASSATGSYKLVSDVPRNLEKIESAVKDAAKKDDQEGKETDANTIYNIIVSTEPAELIQSKGEANFSAVDGTGLLYVSNSENDIFMDINSQTYYVLISGRWYNSKTLSGNWQYVGADKLPADFARIPKGSPKDNVLASVAGTAEANDAVADAQVPQTAKVERSKVHADVQYDGDPEFENIDGTDMAYAVNSPVSVVRWRGRYYCVDDGIWFESRSAVGPWSVALVRPYAVSLIPPRYPVYYMKYVYIYDVTPDYVYMGYTPGYLNAYVYGPTVVYGTGYHYSPWYGRYYYPRPYTWGFGVRYNPWYGWGLGVGFGYDWFHGSVGFGNSYGGWGPWGCGGWWGPRVYRPAYYGSPYHYRGGYYGRNSYNTYRQNNVTIVNNYYNNTNIYRNRTGVISRPTPRTYNPERPRNNGRSEWARANDNNRFNREGAGGRVNGNRNFDNNNREWRNTNRVGSRDNNNTPGNREWRNGANNNNGRVEVPARTNRTERPDLPTRGNREWGNNSEGVRRMPNREAQPQQNNNERVIRTRPQGADMPTNRGGLGTQENRTPRTYEPQQQRSSESPRSSNSGGYSPSQRTERVEGSGRSGGFDGGGRVQPQPQSRPAPSSGGGGYTPSQRVERSSGGDGNRVDGNRGGGSRVSGGERGRRN